MQVRKRQKLNNLPLLPESIVNNILTVYNQPDWSVAFVNKKYYEIVKKEAQTIKRHMRMSLRRIFNQFMYKHESYSDDRKNKLINILMLINQLPINRAIQLKIECPFKLKMERIYNKLNEFKDTWLQYIDARYKATKSKNFMDNYEIYTLLYPLFTYTGLNFNIGIINVDYVMENYIFYSSPGYLYNYITYQPYDFPFTNIYNNIHILNIIHTMIIQLNDYTQSYNEYEYGDTTIEEHRRTINALLESRQQLNTFKIDPITRFMVYEVLDEHLEEYDDLKIYPYLNQYIEYFDSNDLLEYVEIQAIRNNLEFWFLIESILINEPPRIQFLRKMGRMSKICDLLHYSLPEDQLH